MALLAAAFLANGSSRRVPSMGRTPALMRLPNHLPPHYKTPQRFPLPLPLLPPTASSTNSSLSLFVFCEQWRPTTARRPTALAASGSTSTAVRGPPRGVRRPRPATEELQQRGPAVMVECSRAHPHLGPGPHRQRQQPAVGDAAASPATQHGASPLTIFFLLLVLIGVTAVLAVRLAVAALSRSGEG
jgi:hypothetical protein